ncbi:MAG: ATP-dependent protease ATPase subunit HslU [Candidatus Latescibacteria bacterium]|nr:ATP-dependent protease ATPase subunit HslU [Candidatus Latescibacterota bacterium]
MKELTPEEIVAGLDHHIIGQQKAKRAVAIALRNRWRRRQTPASLQTQITPNNVVMIGPTGVGKTEIARRLAQLSQAPFIKVEASKFTEVGYVGRDVESIIRDLTELSVGTIQQQYGAAVAPQADQQAEERLLDLLAPQTNKTAAPAQRQRLRRQLRGGQLEDRLVLVDSQPEPPATPEALAAAADLATTRLDLREFIATLAPRPAQPKAMPLAQARTLLVRQETDKLVDRQTVADQAIAQVENSGIVFLDEIDKIAATEPSKASPDVSREGVQRDLLPLIEGCRVNTRYGQVNTDHILFIAAGAFHTARPADLIPELQGRFPIRVELDSLAQKDLAQILTRPHNALIKQYTALLAADGIELSFSRQAIDEIARLTFEANQSMENIGARRLHTVLSALLEEILFQSSPTPRTVRITKRLAIDKLQGILEDEDLGRYIL